MTVSSHSIQLFGCDILPLDAMVCAQYLAWLLGDKDASEPEGVGSLRWVLAHCYDGVTWGRYDTAQKSWLFGNTIAPDIAPPILRMSILELRIFGELGEVLIWRTDMGLRGRVLKEGESTAQINDLAHPLRPADEARIVLGRHVLKSYDVGFTYVRDGAAKEQVLPIVVTDQNLRSGSVHLIVRNYYEADDMTGAVRVAATRLVNLKIGGNDGA